MNTLVFPYFELYNPIASPYNKLPNSVNIVYTSTHSNRKKPTPLKLISVFSVDWPVKEGWGDVEGCGINALDFTPFLLFFSAKSQGNCFLEWKEKI